MVAEPDERFADDPDEGGAGHRYDIDHVSGSVGASINDSQGPIHAGSGDQRIQYIHNYQAVQEAVRQSLRWVTDDLERDLEPRFVRPPGWEQAHRLLMERRTVLLRGEPGSGRRSAALRLLGECRGSASGHINEVPWESDGSGARLLDPADVAAGSRLILDLSRAEDERFHAVQNELETFRGTVLEQRAFLVVVLPGRRQHLVRDEFQSLVVTLGRPDPVEVLRRHLEAAGIPCAPGELEKSPHVVAIDASAIGEIARLARLAQEARDADPSASIEELLERAQEALADRSAEVAAWIKNHPSAPARALLLATAMFSGGLADAVFTADRRLLEALRFQLGELHELQRPDLGSRLERVGAQMDPTGRVRFTSLNYADAVRAHYWTHFPGLRDGFRDWVIGCGAMPAADGRFVDRFGHECLRVGRPEDLVAAAKAWATVGPINPELARRALEHGLTDQRWAPRFRRQLYDWSRIPDLHPQLAYAVILACTGVLAGSWPGPAMVRLHHLVTHHKNHDVAQAAEDALVELADDGAFFRRLLLRLNEDGYWRLANERSRRLFLRVADPRRITDATDRTRAQIDDPAVNRELVLAWRSVLAHGGKAECAAAVGQWLQSHADGHGDGLLAVLAEASCGAIRLSAELFWCGRRWLEQAYGENGAARATVRRLETAIDEARKARRAEGDGP
jgi:hypothetical protein